MGEPVVCRWSDALCQACQQDILSGGWTPQYHNVLGGGNAADIRCGDCRDRVDRLFHQHGPFNVLPYQWLDDAAYRELAAHHEAAHAVVGEELGMRVDHASLGNEQAEYSAGATTLGGSVHWDIREGDQIRVTDYAAMCSAGMAMEHRLLRERGLDSPENLLDVAYGSSLDMDRIATCTDGEISDETYTQALVDANAIVGERWHEIRAVTEELRRHGRLDRDAVKRAMREGHRRPIAQSASTQPSSDTNTAPAPAAAPEPITTNASGGTAAMGIDEIRARLSGISRECNDLRGVLAEAEQHADDLRGRLGALLNGADASEASEALGTLGRLLEQVGESLGLVGVTQEAVESYGGRL